ncbi:MAG: hypothetical protein CL927_20530 [Deltaproteobacteria bacterium]|nr:hypothetical protein [Deltaproteobacteria bacterium]HCH64819.1 hypothetical protein [Deltaproteobacteria bacterium]
MQVSLFLSLLFALPLHAKRPEVPKVPSIEEVVAAEGFTPTPSQSEIYKPGAVLVPNGRGGHDVVVDACIDVEPSIAIMSQSSIATTLAGGVSARLGVTRGSASAGVEKRLSFVDPEQRTIALGALVPTEDCLSSVNRAGKLQDLSEAIVMHDVLVAIIKNTVCTKADVSGGIVALGATEAAAYSECVQESDGQVPLGYKAVSLDRVLGAVNAPVPTTPASTGSSTPAAASSSVQFGAVGSLDVEAKLKEQTCTQTAQAKGAEARRVRIAEATAEAQDKATAAWNQLESDVTACTKLKRDERTACVDAVEQWLSVARAMTIDLPAGEETMETECGTRRPAFAAERTTVAARELATVEGVLRKLQAGDTVAAALVPSAGSGRVLTFGDTRAAGAGVSGQQAREKRLDAIKKMEGLLAKGISGSQKAEITSRLAGRYLDESSALRLKEAQSHQAQVDQCTNTPGCNAKALKPDHKDSDRWAEKSIRLYRSVLAEFPTYSRADEVLYALANALASAGERAEAVKNYTRLVRQYPQSTYLAAAHVGIGEYYFDANNAFKALSAYKRAVSYRDGPQYAFASYKLAWCYYNASELGPAVSTMKQVATLTRSEADGGQQAALIHAKALEALVRFFRDAGSEGEGRAFFRNLGREDLAEQL